MYNVMIKIRKLTLYADSPLGTQRVGVSFLFFLIVTDVLLMYFLSSPSFLIVVLLLLQLPTPSRFCMPNLSSFAAVVGR